jgi:hypothetical protein
MPRMALDSAVSPVTRITIVTHTPTVDVVLLFVSTMIAVTAVGVALWQARLASRASQAAALRDLIDRLQSATARSDRGILLETARAKVAYTNWDNATKEAAERMAQTFNIAGILLQEKMVPKSFLRHWGVTISRCWAAMKPYNAHLRVARQNPDTHIMFEWLAEKAKPYEAGRNV